MKQEFFDRKCCSLKRKDLNHHYKKMAERFYMLNDYNDESLTQVYINSLPDELHADLQRQITATHRPLSNITLGEIHQMALAALERLCDTQKLITKMIKELVLSFSLIVNGQFVLSTCS
ncbi:hypothetical protein ACOSP7_026764 [Xanthoceras sorbifolium]